MKPFSGVITAIVTPFKDNNVDYDSLESLIKHQIEGGVQGFVVHGTTGESPTVTGPERKMIFDFIKSKVPVNFPLIVGTGSNSTAQSIDASIEAETWGADAVLLVVPYYNKPPQRGLFEHFKAIASAIKIPAILYNVPGRTITALELETIKKLAEHPTIIGIKEASGNVEFAKQIRQACGAKFLLLSGDDGTFDEFMKAGGDGVISVASHVMPQAFLKREVSKSLALVDLLFCEANPMPVKMALHLMGVIETPDCRLPLMTLSAENKEKLKKALSEKGLLK